MADYHPLITRAVDGLGNNTADARRTLYERARAALVAQLRGIDPPLSEAEITRERLALEDAIRKVEAESVRKARSEPRPAAPRSINATSRPHDGGASPPISGAPAWRDRPAGPLGDMSLASRSETRFAETARKDKPPPPDQATEPLWSEPPRPGPQTSARSRLLDARSSQRPREEFKGFRNLTTGADLDASPSTAKAPPTHGSYNDHEAAPHQFSQAQEEGWHDGGAGRFADDHSSDLLEDAPPPVHGFEQAYDFDDQQPIEPVRPQPHRPIARAERHRQPRPPRSYSDLIKLAVAVLVVAGVAVLVSWQWSNISGLYQFLSHLRSRPTQTSQAPQGEPKFPGRVPQQDQTRQPPATAAPNAQSGPVVAQRVVLYEEDSSNPQGKQLVGSAVWRTETVSPGSGLAPELQVRADITVPERNMTVTWTLRRNTDQALPASHTIEIMFNLPADFPGGGIANVPGVLMKESEQARGVPLAGLAVKVTNGFFLIGLSAVDADVQRNIQLLKDRPWFDIPIVYNNGGRAILALEKGPPGDRAFADAFAAWGK
jgi:hypothetical protein